MAVTQEDSVDAQGPQHQEANEGILKAIMALRGLDISAESKFDFVLPAGCARWPAPHYGPDSPHLQSVKTPPRVQVKRRHAASPPSRSGKVRKAKDAHTKASPDPSRDHGIIPKREPPVHLLTLPGELRDIIYDLLVLQKGAIYPQYRPVHTRRHGKVLRRYPQEPPLALANRQLRHEVLSLFYGANLFVFRRSQEEFLHALSMTDAGWMTKWYSDCTPTLSGYLRHIELRYDAQTRDGPLTLTYTLKKTAEGLIDVTHDLGGTGYCHCLEDDAVAEMRAQAQVIELSDLVRVATVLSRKRKMKLNALAKRDDDEEGMYKMPTATCLYCRKRHLKHVSAG